MSPDQIKQIQAALDKNGFHSGRANGKWGPETRTGLEKFQKSKGMIFGERRIDQRTLSAPSLNPDQFATGAMGSQTQGMRRAATNKAGSAANPSTASQQRMNTNAGGGANTTKKTP